MGVDGGHVNQVCGVKPEDSLVAPEVELSCMLKNELGVHIAPQALRLFMRYHWMKVQKLAHQIHDTV